MSNTGVPTRQSSAAVLAKADDPELVDRVTRGDQRAFEALMRRHNGRLFRVARAILKNDADAEEALQDAYLDAYRHIRTFEGASRFETWMTRIVINQALMRLRKRQRDRVVVPFASTRRDADDRSESMIADERTESPPMSVLRGEVRQLVERRIDELPDQFRVVFVMREVQEMSTEEIAECLSIPAATVRTRIFRARALLREALARDLDLATLDVFRFDGDRCDRIVTRVLHRLQEITSSQSYLPIS